MFEIATSSTEQTRIVSNAHREKRFQLGKTGDLAQQRIQKWEFYDEERKLSTKKEQKED